MRRPRHRLEVSTFPFLAVLLCAMGSLILLLLVLDRRAKAVGRAKAEEAARAARMERDDTARAAAEAAAQRVAERAAERERQRLGVHEELVRAKDDLDGQLRAVDERQADAARGVQSHRNRWRKMLEILGNQREELAKAEREAAAGQGTAREAEQLSESARKEVARLSAQLRGLELVLDELKAARKREAQTYSLLPYRGRRGDGRRPIYVECTGNGLLFHPDRRTLSRIASYAEICGEVDLRVEWQRKRVLASGGQPDKRPYLLMLVRPDGIPSYYTAVAALQGREVDFGYEFVDADWVLDFPEDDSTAPKQPWMTARRTQVAPGDASDPTRKVSGLRPGRNGGGDPYDGAETAVANGAGTGGGTRGEQSDLPPLPAELKGRGQSGGGVVGNVPVAAGSPENPPGAHGGRLTFDRTGWHGQQTGSQGGSGIGSPGATASPSGTSSDLPPLPGALGSAGTGVNGGRPSGSSGAVAGAGGTGSGGAPAPGASTATPGQPTGGGANGSNAFPTGGGVGNSGGSRPGGGAVPGQPVAASGAAGVAGGTGSGAPGGVAPAGGGPTPAGSMPGTAPQEAVAGQSAAAPGTPSALPPLNPSEQRAGPSVAGAGLPGGARGGAAPADGSAAAPDTEEPPSPHLDAGRLPGRGRGSPAAPRPLRLIGNRDWVIPVECRGDSVVLRNAGQRFPAATLSRTGADNPFLQSLSQMIARRQATVRPGEPPYRPQVRFLIYPDGLRTYFLAFPALEPLGITMTRQDVKADAPTRPAP
jgi:hypothetical protein